MFKKLLKALKGDSSKTSTAAAVASDPVIYKDVTITPAPLPEGGQFKTAGTISQIVDGEEKKTEFIRADNHTTVDAAIEHSINKAKQIVDERGASLFNSERC